MARTELVHKSIELKYKTIEMGAQTYFPFLNNLEHKSLKLGAQTQLPHSCPGTCVDMQLVLPWTMDSFC